MAMTSEEANHPDLYWDSTYAIAMALLDTYPDKKPIDTGFEELAQLVELLPGFQDDPALVTDRLLTDILNVWYEEATTL